MATPYVEHPKQVEVAMLCHAMDRRRGARQGRDSTDVGASGRLFECCRGFQTTAEIASEGVFLRRLTGGAVPEVGSCGNNDHKFSDI